MATINIHFRKIASETLSGFKVSEVFNDKYLLWK